MMAAARKQLGLWHGLLISAAVHALVASLFFLPDLFPRREPRNNLLQVEVFGMIADRQTAEKKLGETTPPAPAVEPQPVPPPSPPPPSPKREVPKERKTARSVTGEAPSRFKAASPVVVAEQAEPPPESASAAVPTPPRNAPPPAGENQQQIQQTIRPVSEADLLRRYLVGLKKRLADKLIYPDSLKRSGLNGVPKVGFVVMADGRIRNGTLRITRSSGIPELDLNALSTVMAVAPFEPPPREISVAIDMQFKAQD